MKIELKPHPAQARNPKTDEPLFNDDGSAVSLFPELRSIYLDGALVGYTGSPPKRGICLTVSGMVEEALEKIKAAVCEEFELDEIEKVAAPARGVLEDGEE